MIISNHENSFPSRPILYGSFIALIVVALFTLILTFLTEFGWTGTVFWSNNLFLVSSYVGVTIGSIMAGLRSHEQGWLIGLGVGILSSIWMLILAFILGDVAVHWGLFFTKSSISGFIGVFGGIIGVNLSGNRM